MDLNHEFGLESLAFMSPDAQRILEYEFISQWFVDGGTMLDVGCGSGGFMGIAASKGMMVSGIDGDPANVEAARSMNLDVSLQDIFADARELYDLITMIHIVEHFSPSDVARLLAIYSQRLRTGGHLLVITPNFADWTVASNIFWLDPTHVRPYPLDLLVKMLRATGLRVVHASNERFLRGGLKSRVRRPIGRLRFGRDYERANTVAVARSTREVVGAPAKSSDDAEERR